MKTIENFVFLNSPYQFTSHSHSCLQMNSIPVSMSNCDILYEGLLSLIIISNHLQAFQEDSLLNNDI